MVVLSRRISSFHERKKDYECQQSNRSSCKIDCGTPYPTYVLIPRFNGCRIPFVFYFAVSCRSILLWPVPLRARQGAMTTAIRLWAGFIGGSINLRLHIQYTLRSKVKISIFPVPLWSGTSVRLAVNACVVPDDVVDQDVLLGTDNGRHSLPNGNIGDTSAVLTLTSAKHSDCIAPSSCRRSPECFGLLRVSWPRRNSISRSIQEHS